MRTMARRDALRCLGWVSGAASVSSLAATDSPALHGDNSGDHGAAEAETWEYTPLDANATRRSAYGFYKGHGCMYAVFRGVLETWGQACGRPAVDFPFGMMDYGHGGAAGYGSLCGALNGAAAVISLFEPAQRWRDVMIVDLFKWYETAAFPMFQPKDGAPISTSVSGSVLCHASIAHWCQVSKQDPYSATRGERCRRLSADVAGKAAELLNQHQVTPRRETTVTDSSRDCMRCHAPSGNPTVTVRTLMSCDSCHTMPTPHPSVKLPDGTSH